MPVHARQQLWWRAWLAIGFAVALVEAAEAEPLPKVALGVTPAYARIEVASGAQADLVVTLQVPETTSILSVSADCGCLQSRDTLPMTAQPGATELHLRATGILPGIKTVTVRTTLGTTSSQVQVVTPGFGEGAQILEELKSHDLLVIVHDLHGETRNCGCSSGSLGGIEHLAALATALPRARLVLTGTVSGSDDSAAKALARRRWEVQPADVLVSDDPLTALHDQRAIAIIARGGAPVANQRVVRPLLGRGALAHVLVLTGGTVVAQRILPIDRTLPSDARILAELPQVPQAVTIDHAASPSTSCSTCHQAAHQTWAGSAHAHAFDSLPPADQTTRCATCHSTGLPERVERAENVGCTACHLGAERHAAAPATVRVSGRVDCRSCHDAQHHPDFDPVAAWLRIRHGK